MKATKPRRSGRSRPALPQHPDGLLVVALDGVGMSDEAFKALGHDPAAPNAVIMSVVVDPGFQRRGHASQLLRELVDRMRRANRKNHSPDVPTASRRVYTRPGCRSVKPSDSTHGGVTWHEVVVTRT